MTVVAKLEMGKLEELIRTFPEKAEATVRAGALAVDGKAKTVAPMDTGALKNSIHAYSVGRLHWQVSDGVEYGIYQELGTSRHAAQPFMLPAVEWARPQWERMWREMMSKV